MDSEFVNAFIARQKRYIEELTAKLLLVETQQEISTSTINKLNDEIGKLKTDLEKSQKQKKQSSEI